MFLLEGENGGMIGGLVALATVLGGIIKWVGRDVVKVLEKLVSGLTDNTTAVRENTAVRKDSTKIQTGGLVLLPLALVGLLLVGCKSGPDPLEVSSVERGKTIWLEDRRPPATLEQWTQWTRDLEAAEAAGDKAAAAAARHLLETHLDPDLATSRGNEFAAMERYARSK